MTDDRQVLAIRLRELDHMSEHIDPVGLTLRLADMAIEASGLEMGDVLDLYTRIETHATAHRIAVLSSREATDEELQQFVQSKSMRDYLVPNPETGKFEPAAIEEEQVEEPQPEPDEPEVKEELTDLTEEAKVETHEPERQVEIKEEPTEKTCKSCGETKPVDMFSRNRYGPTSLCKSCLSDRQKRARDRSKASFQKVSKEKTDDSEGSTAKESESSESSRVRLCANGETCVSFERQGRPTRIAEDNDTGICAGCHDIDAGLDEAFAKQSSKPDKPKKPKTKFKHCSRGTECVAYTQIGEPTRMSVTTKRHICFPCERAKTQAMMAGTKVEGY